MNLIYISGYGRSGSTILEIILNKEKNIKGLGEISNFKTAYLKDELCSCNNALSNCDFWKPVVDDFQKNNVLKSNSKTQKFFSFFVKNDRIESKKLLETLNNHYPENVFVDSSKSTRKSFMRPFFFRKNHNVKIIHIVKDSRDCVLSNKLKSNSKSLKGIEEPVKFAFVRTTISWISANLFFFLYKMSYNKKNITVLLYSDLVHRYNETIDGLNNFLSDFDVNISKEKEFENISHTVRGNRISRKKNIIIKNHNRDYSQLKWFEKGILSIFCNPLYHILSRFKL